MLFGSKVQRRYQEAFPRINAAAAVRASLTSVNRFIWEDQDNNRVGQCAVSEANGDDILIASKFYLRKQAEEVSFIINVVNASNHENHRTFGAFICPHCQLERKSLVFIGHWTCRKCSDLPYRVQLIGSWVAKWEELGRLQSEVGSGRPKGMHNRTYRAKREKLRALKNALGREPLVANEEFRLVITGRWIDPERDRWMQPQPLPEFSPTEAARVKRSTINFALDAFDGMTS
jgi:protein-arginine kinase activator protein McsA